MVDARMLDTIRLPSGSHRLRVSFREANLQRLWSRSSFPKRPTHAAPKSNECSRNAAAEKFDSLATTTVWAIQPRVNVPALLPVSQTAGNLDAGAMRPRLHQLPPAWIAGRAFAGWADVQREQYTGGRGGRFNAVRLHSLLVDKSL